MDRAVPVVAALLLALSLAIVPLASAHTNEVTADPQISANGTITAELVYTVTDSWLVVHRDDNGSVGEPIGHGLVRSAGGFKTNQSVQVDGSAWSDWSGTQTVHLVLHNADGDGEFDPDDDPILTTGDRPVSSTIAVERGDARATVGAEGFHPATTNGTATVRTAQLPTDGLLVLHDGAADGPVVGTTSLAAGTHHDVTVALNESFYRAQHDRFRLTAVLYRDDGDGVLGSEDTQLRAGDEPVATGFHLEPNDTSTPTPTQSPTPSPTEGSVDTETTANGDGHDHDHDTTTTAAGESDTATTVQVERNATTEDGDGHDHDHTHSATDASGPGFGVGLSLVAISVGFLLWRRGRR